MKPPVEHVRVSAKGKEILIKIKRRTGLQHWNEICRLALCRSLANSTPLPKCDKTGESSIDMDWKTFAGQLSGVLSGLIIYKANKDKIDVQNKDELGEYLRMHLERGIQNLNNTTTLQQIVHLD